MDSPTPSDPATKPSETPLTTSPNTDPTPSKPSPRLLYDRIAEGYDDLYSEPDHLAENEELRQLLPKPIGSVLDIGCGTGLLLDLMDMPPRSYVGIDPSPGMITKHRQKHPRYVAQIATAETWHSPADTLYALFSASYISSLDHFDRLWTGKGARFLMFYNHRIADRPRCYRELNTTPSYPHYSYHELQQAFPKAIFEKWHDYIIIRESRTLH